jgi:phage gp45-like
MLNIKRAVEKSIDSVRNSLMGKISSVLKSNNTVYVRINQEEIRDIKIISPYGLFSLPLNNQNGQILFNNTTKKASLIGIEHDNLPIEINPGEVILYGQSGSYILLREGKIFINGDLNVTGNITYSGNISKG